MIRSLAIALTLGLAMPAQASDAEDFVTSNVISALYHELGHALIHLTDASVLGREEDAVDTLAVILLDELWEEDSAQLLTAMTALSFELAAQENEDPAYWDVHGHNMQRYYNQICLFYGANPDARAELASTFELPDQRAATCVEEYNLASASWEAVLEPLKVGGSGRSIPFQGDSGTDIGALLESEVADLNEIFTLPEHVIVAYESCGEENAFYDPASLTITICSEYVDFLERQAIASDL